MRVLVSGGAGYIGSHTVLQLIAAGHDVLVVDNFANAKPTVVNRLEALSGRHLPVHAFDLRDADKTEHLFAHEQIDAVIHFAGHKAVGESVEKPLEYYENNLGSTFSLVRAMQRHDVRPSWSSPRSATVYGEHATAPIGEDLPDLGDQPLRLDQGDDRADPARRRRGRARDGGSRCCATSTRSAPTPPAPSARTPRASRTTWCRTSRRSRSAGARS